MAKSISVGKLSGEVQAILEQYRDDIADGVDEAAQRCASQCLKDIRDAAKRLFKDHGGGYAKQWTKKQTEKARGKSASTVFCKKPGLPHLLENGHAKAGGGRVAGRPHIATAEENAVQEFQKDVEEVIENAGG